NTCKALLPEQFSITSIDSLRERSQLCFKAALYHIHTYTIENCTTLPNNIEHNVKNLSSNFFEESFKHFPAPTNSDPSSPPKPKWLHPILNTSIFRHDNEFSATFQKPTPVTYLRQLVAKTEIDFLELNKLNKSDDHDITRESYYFYSYFKAYLKAAAINDQIDNLHLEQAIDKITSKPIDTHFLARVITYFYILKSSDKLSMSYIRKAYKECFYPEAEKTLLSKFKIQFKAPKINTDFFKPKPNKTNEKNILNPPHTTQLNKINKTL